MDKAKVKNYILLVLVLVNAFLLAIVATNARQAARAASQRKQALSAVLTQNGITLSSDVRPAQDIPPQITLRRDTAREKEMVAAVLGDADVTDLGGNVYYYKAKSGGEAKFRGTGEFTILFSENQIARGSDAAQTAKDTLAKLGLTCSTTTAVDGSDGSEEVTLCCTREDTPVYNARVTFYFTAQYLRLITGTRPFDTQLSSAVPDNCADGVTALMDFLQSLHSSGNTCAEIRGLDIGYFSASSVSGDCTLSPVWCIRTDTGSYYIDAETGKAETFDVS